MRHRPAPPKTNLLYFKMKKNSTKIIHLKKLSLKQSRELEETKMVGGKKMKDEQAHGIGWKIYFVIFILFQVLLFFGNVDPIDKIFGGLHLVLSTTVLYSWIWARRIGWLSKIRWLVKLWSIQFFFAPIALAFYGYLALTKGDPKAIGWLIAIVILYPALYAIYRIAWRSHLLYKPGTENHEDDGPLGVQL